MIVSFEKIDDISSPILNYYSIKIGIQELTEFDLFDEKDFPEHTEELKILYNVIMEMKKRGAKHYYFLNESSADYLPKVTEVIKDANKDDFGLRLYCKRLRDDIVVLFNGDIKTTVNPQYCDNVQVHFRRAITIGLRLDKAVFNKDIDLNDENPFDNFELDI